MRSKLVECFAALMLFCGLTTLGGFWFATGAIAAFRGQGYTIVEASK